MDARTREETRGGVSRSRTRPHRPQRVFLDADGLGECAALEPGRAAELHIEAVSHSGQLTPWLTDQWWIRMHQRCPRQGVSIVILAAPAGILHEVICHQLEMIRRIAPGWRIIGYARAEEASREPALQRWLCSPFDEIRFCADASPEGRTALAGAEHLVRQAALTPRAAGLRQSCLRVVHSWPRPLDQPGASPRSSTVCPVVREVRVSEYPAVEST